MARIDKDILKQRQGLKQRKRYLGSKPDLRVTDKIKYKDDLNYHNTEALRNQRASALDMSNILNRRTDKRKNLVDHYILLHQTVVENTTDKEWSRVVQKINKIF